MRRMLVVVSMIIMCTAIVASAEQFPYLELGQDRTGSPVLDNPRNWLNCFNYSRQPSRFESPPRGESFYSYDLIVAKLDELETAYPNLVTSRDAEGQTLHLGVSHRGREIPYVSLTAADSENLVGRVFLNGMIHGNEPGSMMLCMYLLCDWTERYGSDPEITHLLDTREIIVAPVLNPDGWIRTYEDNMLHRRNYPNSATPV